MSFLVHERITNAAGMVSPSFGSITLIDMSGQCVILQICKGNEYFGVFILMHAHLRVV